MQDATTAAYPLYTSSLPSGAKFSPFLRNRPRAGCHFPARPVFMGGLYIGGYLRIYCPIFSRTAFPRRGMSLISPNKYISAGGAIYYHFIWIREREITLRTLRRIPLQIRSPIGRVSVDRISGIVGFYARVARRHLLLVLRALSSFCVRGAAESRPPATGNGDSASLAFGQYTESRPR